MSSANPSESAAAEPSYSVSCDPSRLDVAWVVHSVLGSYWGGALAGAQIRAALQGSLCFGAYADGKQNGLVRIVTDGAIFSSVCDVFVEEAHRGKGVGTALMTAAMAHPSVAGTLCILRARPAAQLWYFKNWGFQLLDKQHGIMQRQPQ
jgi:GNAT superfamily N-acetyltransferase